MTPTNTATWRFKKRWILYVLLAMVGVSIAQGLSAPWRFMHSSATKATYAPKTGRIVNGDTGEGVADVILIINGWYYSEISRASIVNLVLFSLVPIHVPGNGGRHDLYTVVTTSDKDGNFSIASTYEQTWDSIKNEGRGFTPHAFQPDWKITPIKLGYLPGVVDLHEKWAAIVKDSSGDKAIAVGETKMTPVKSGPAGFKEEMMAYQYWGNPFGVVATETAALSKQAYPYFTSEVCALGTDESIELHDLNTMLRFVPSKSVRVMKLLNPDQWEFTHLDDQNLTGEQYYKRIAELKKTGNLDKVSYKAGDICQAMKPSPQVND
jgi:hypothetical protein